MDNVASTRINSFWTSPKADFESPSRDQLITLTAGQLQDIITKAVQEAIQLLQDHIETLGAAIVCQDEKIAALTATQEHDTNRIYLDIAYDRQRISKQRPLPAATPTAPPKGAKTLARIAKIHDVLKTRGATNLKELKRILNIAPKEMNRLLAKLDMRRYELHPRPGDGREKVLRLRVQIS
jgi:DNA integrity scanning protein DisA with diadenylate cyclase activity